MTREIRWRILTLQIIATLVLAFMAGVTFWAHSFTQSQVTQQLTAQQIVFPPAASPALKALPAVDASAMSRYAGQTMTTGDQAKVYADHFIAVHLKEIGQGKTYAYWSGKALAEKTTNPTQFAKDEGIAQTMFQGTTLRSMLLNAWAFYFVGSIALYAAIGLTIGTILTFLAFLYELLVEPQREGVVDLKSRKVSAPLAV
ncbi:MAG TPA: hypothetical protein VFB58_01635 [Chloroflexota bacterium]|nr:hypothetical protein [Chloroflexota bacterium]